MVRFQEQQDRARKLGNQLVYDKRPQLIYQKSSKGDAMEIFRPNNRLQYTGSGRPQVSKETKRQIVDFYDFTPDELHRHKMREIVTAGPDWDIDPFHSPAIAMNVSDWTNSYTREFVERHYDDLKEFRSRVIAEHRSSVPPKIQNMSMSQLKNFCKAYLKSQRYGHHRPQICSDRHHHNEYYDDDDSSYPFRQRSPRRQPMYVFDRSPHHHRHDGHRHDRHHSPRYDSPEGSPFAHHHRRRPRDNYHYGYDHSDDEGYDYLERRQSF